MNKLPRTKSPWFSFVKKNSLFTASLQPRAVSPWFSRSLNKTKIKNIGRRFTKFATKTRRRKLLSVLLIILILLGSVRIWQFAHPEEVAAWWDDSWHYRKQLIIDNTKVSGSTDLTDFPVLVSLTTDTDLSANAQADGDDIVFTGLNGEILDHEIESYASGTLVAWVRIPTLFATEDTGIYMYYGNSTVTNQQNVTGVWDSNYVAVWHLNETSGVATDSTTTPANLTVNGDVTQTFTGKIDDADDFNDTGEDDTLDWTLDTANSKFDITGNITLEAWINPDGDTEQNQRIVQKRGVSVDRSMYAMTYEGDTDTMVLYGSPDGGISTNNMGESSTTVTDTSWNHVVATFDDSADETKLYINGTNGAGDTDTETDSLTTNDGRIEVGGVVGRNERGFAGAIDEVRISNVTRSDGWVITEYNNQNSPATFFSTNSQEVGPGPVGYWAFDEGVDNTCSGSTNDACDSTANGNDGAFGATTAAPTWQTEDMCVSGKCLYFDGSDDVVDIGQPSELDFTEDDNFTIAVWVKVQNLSGTTNDQDIVTKWAGGTSNTQYALKIEDDGNYVKFATYDGAWKTASSSNNTISENKWHFVVGVAENDTWRVYVDGIEGTTTSTVGTITSRAQSVKIGYGENYFDGFIDEVKIYPYARSANEIKADYASRGSSKGVSAQFGPDNKWLSDGLVGYWKMDESALNGCSGGEDSCDSSGNGNHGTFEASMDVNDMATGKFGNGVDFDGTDDYVNVGSVLSGPETITLGAWIYPADIVGDDRVICKATSSSSNDHKFCLIKAADKIQVRITTADNNSNKVESSSVIQTNSWQHVAFTYDGSNINLYYNGALQGCTAMFLGGNSSTCTPTGSIITSTTDTILGNTDAGVSSGYFNGNIDDARIYNRALSPSEVKGLYEWAPGPVGYWKMDENTGTTTYDRSGNSNNGTISNAQWKSGKFGSALGTPTNNTQEYVTITDPAGGELDVAAGQDISYGLWFNSTSYEESPLLINKLENRSGSLPGYNLIIIDAGSSDAILCELYDGTNYDDSALYYANGDLEDGVWHHLMCVLDRDGSEYGAAGIYLFLDGVQVGSDTSLTATGSFANSENLLFGETDSGDLLNGGVDDVRIYNYARTPAQIIEDMNAGHPLDGSPVGSAIGHWKFDEMYGDTTNDSGTGGNDGDLAGSGTTCPTTSSSCPTWSTAGKINNALSFDGSDDYIDITESYNYDNFTVSAWIYDTSGSGARYIYSNSESSVDGVTFSIKNSPTDVLSCTYDNLSAQTTATISTGQWYHITCTADDTNIKIYINGQEMASTSNTDDDIDVSSGARIGRGQHLADFPFGGFIDEVKIYNTALTPNQVKIDMNAGSVSSFSVLGDTEASTLEGGAGNPPVGYWSMDENTGTGSNAVKDHSGNGNDGTMEASMTESDWVPGKYGSALDFDGNDDEINFGDLDIVDNTDLTYTAWINLDGYSAGPDECAILSKWGNGGADRHLFRVSTGGALEMGGSSGLWDRTADSKITLGEWQHVAVVRDITTGDVVSFYRNGVPLSLSTDDDLASWSTFGIDPYSIGRRDDGADECDGKIDEVKVFNYELTPAQIAYDYNRGKPVGWWRFDECQGATAYDASGNGNNGTITPGDTSGSNDSVGTCSSGAGDEMWDNGTTGKFNGSLDFDGTNDYVDMEDVLDEDGTDPFSVASWVKIPSDSSQNSMLVSKELSSGDGTGWSLFYNDSSNQIQFNLVNKWSVVFNQINRYAAYDLEDDIWHHVVGTYDGSQTAAGTKIYIDGNLGTLSTGHDSLSASISNAASFNIGARDDGGLPLIGQIDDVRIYNYALSQKQIRNIMNYGAVSFR